MPRFSEKAKKIFDLIWYSFDIEESIAFSKQLTNPSDILFAKIWIIYYYFSFFRPDLGLTEIKEADVINHIIPNKFYSFFIDTMYFSYYSGFNYINPIISIDLSKEYFNKVESNYTQIEPLDDWEKYFCKGWYYVVKGIYHHRIENNLEQGLIFVKKSKEAFLLVPRDGEFFGQCIGNIDIAFFQRLAGQFDESEKNYQTAFEEAKKYDDCVLGQLTPLFNLSLLNIQKGDLNKAMEYIEDYGKLSKKFNYIAGIFYYLGVKGDLFYEEGKYDEALESYQESIVYRKQYDDPLEVVKGYLDIFFLYYLNFKISKQKEYFKKAEDIFFEIQKLYEQYPDNQSITNYKKFSEAQILKYGNLSKRAKSVSLFEELINVWPNNFDIVKEYLELLFEDFLISEDQETIEKIDFLMKKVDKYPLSIISIYSFMSQQLMLARYQFYIKDNIELAFEILTKARERISPYRIERYTFQLENELNTFRNERTKWDKVDYSTKERIEKSEFKKYIQEALKTKLV